MKRKYLEISISLSIISIAITLFINHKIAEAYLKADGKTRAVFLPELLVFGYQYYVAMLGIVALILAITGVKKNSQTTKKFLAVLLSLLAIVIVFIRSWRLFI